MYVLRPHKCDQCEKSFQKPSDLKKHKDLHSGKNDFINLLLKILM